MNEAWIMFWSILAVIVVHVSFFMWWTYPDLRPVQLKRRLCGWYGHYAVSVIKATGPEIHCPHCGITRVKLPNG